MQGVAPNRNALWARAIAQELRRSGVAHACICPGNRSGPLAFALAAEPGLKVWSHIDERSAAFFALGLAKALRAPVALLCTTGTAAANFLPAVIEANHARVPLVVLTADRPADLRDTGANQAIDQVGLFGKQVRWAADLAEPRPEDRALRHLRTQVCRAVATATGSPPGPVHLNAPFAKPLEPTLVPGDVPADFEARFPLAAQGRRDGAPFARAGAAPRTPDATVLRDLAARLAGRRGVVVLGPSTDPRLAPAAASLARALGWPLLADPLGGARFGPASGAAIAAYDAFLQGPAARAALAPEVAVRLGAAPTSDALLAWLEASQAWQLHVDDDPGWRDPLHLPAERLLADPALACEGLAAHAAPAAAAWLGAWRACEQAARAALASGVRDAWFEGRAVAAALDAAPADATLVIGNSLAVRDLDRFGAPRAKALRILGNRGASGIDGMTSTALGVAAAAQGPVLLLTGDLAFYHDLPGLMAFRRCGVAATAVVLHNDGGRIFDQLPAALYDPPYTELFATPHGLDFGPAAAMFGANFQRAGDAAGFEEALGRALKEGGPQVLEARISPAASRDARAHATRGAAAAAEDALRGLGLAR